MDRIVMECMRISGHRLETIPNSNLKEHLYGDKMCYRGRSKNSTRGRVLSRSTQFLLLYLAGFLLVSVHQNVISHVHFMLSGPALRELEEIVPTFAKYSDVLLVCTWHC